MQQHHATGAEENPVMIPRRLIVSDNRDDPGNPLVLGSDAIEGAAQDPVAMES